MQCGLAVTDRARTGRAPRERMNVVPKIECKLFGDLIYKLHAGPMIAHMNACVHITTSNIVL